MAERIARNDSNNRARAAVFAPTARQPGEWTVADVLYQGRSRRLATRDVQDLVRRAVALVEANAASRSSTNANANAHAHANAEADGGASVSAAPEAEADFGAPVLRLELLNQSRTAAVAQFDLWGSNAFRWQRAGQADVAGTLTPEAAAGLLAEAARALPP